MEISYQQLIDTIIVIEKIMANPQVSSDKKEKAGKQLNLLLDILDSFLKHE